MTVIAWDGRSIAADKRAICAGLCNTTTKLRRFETVDGPGVLAWSGDQDAGELLAQWYLAGAGPATWPECQKDKDLWTRLIVATRRGVRFYERQPVSVRVEDPFMAWGSGRDFAVAAMYLGKTAREAVELACLFDCGCGNGVDVEELK